MFGQLLLLKWENFLSNLDSVRGNYRNTFYESSWLKHMQPNSDKVKLALKVMKMELEQDRE